MRIRSLILIGLALLVVSAAAAGQAAAPDAVKYVATRSGDHTTIRAVRVSDGKVLRSRSIAGAYSVPAVAADGSRDGVSGDGSTLVLAAPAAKGESRFALVSTSTLAVRRTIDLAASFTYDAVSPNANVVYFIQFLEGTRYQVRAYSPKLGRLFEQVVVAKGEAGEPMEGYAVTRATSRDGEWAYTLYGREGAGKAFVHSLATEYRFALCIDLPWSASRATMLKVKMSVAPNGDLTLRDRKGRIAVIDGVNHQLRSLRSPVG
jgi:hypothetical protein